MLYLNTLCLKNLGTIIQAYAHSITKRLLHLPSRLQRTGANVLDAANKKIVARRKKITFKDLLKKVDKVAETLAKELESLSAEGLHEFFKFVYKMNHVHGNMMTTDSFDEFLSAFEDNPFKINDNKTFRKQLIDNIIKYAFDHMSLITAAVLIKKKFTTEELARNYYASVDVFDGNWF